MDNDKLIISRIQDKISQAVSGYYAVATGFLDAHEQSVTRSVSRQPGVSEQAHMILYGGYEGADRCILITAPRDLADTPEEVLSFDKWLAAVRISYAKGSRKLTHRDYLGSLLRLGIERSVIGDILVRDDGADIIIKPEISDFLLSEYRKAGRAYLNIELIDIEDVKVPEQRVQEVNCTISSLRLDNLVAAAFGTGRSEAAQAITRGMVFVDHEEMLKTDKRIEEGQTISVRGKGKVVLSRIGGATRKGRLSVTFTKYI